MTDTENNNGTAPDANKEPEQNQERTEKKKRPTRGRPARETPEPPKWQIRGVEPETRAIIEKAASLRNNTLGEFFNQEIREYCTGQIKKSKQPPATQDDVKAMVQAELTVFKTELLEALATREAQAAATEPQAERRSFWARLFNKS